MLNQKHKIKTTNRFSIHELIQTLMSDAILKVKRYSFTVAIYYVSTSLMKWRIIIGKQTSIQKFFHGVKALKRILKFRGL